MNRLQLPFITLSHLIVLLVPCLRSVTASKRPSHLFVQHTALVWCCWPSLGGWRYWPVRVPLMFSALVPACVYRPTTASLQYSSALLRPCTAWHKQLGPFQSLLLTNRAKPGELMRGHAVVTALWIDTPGPKSQLKPYCRSQVVVLPANEEAYREHYMKSTKRKHSTVFGLLIVYQRPCIMRNTLGARQLCRATFRSMCGAWCRLVQRSSPTACHEHMDLCDTRQRLGAKSL